MCSIGLAWVKNLILIPMLALADKLCLGVRSKPAELFIVNSLANNRKIKLFDAVKNLHTISSLESEDEVLVLKAFAETYSKNRHTYAIIISNKSSTKADISFKVG